MLSNDSQPPLPGSRPGCLWLLASGREQPRANVIDHSPQPIVGQCASCSGRLQGRHPLQTSDALGAAGVQLGAKTHALMTWLNKRLGLSHGKVQEFFQRVFALRLCQATSCRSMLRTAQLAEPAAAEIRQQIRGSPYVVPDETGWRIGGSSAWLHVAVGESETVVQVERGRGHEPLANLIGLDYTGRLIHDAYTVIATA